MRSQWKGPRDASGNPILSQDPDQNQDPDQDWQVKEELDQDPNQDQDLDPDQMDLVQVLVREKDVWDTINGLEVEQANIKKAMQDKRRWAADYEGRALRLKEKANELADRWDELEEEKAILQEDYQKCKRRRLEIARIQIQIQKGGKKGKEKGEGGGERGGASKGKGKGIGTR